MCILFAMTPTQGNGSYHFIKQRKDKAYQVSGLRRAEAASAAQAGVCKQMKEDRKQKSNKMFLGTDDADD